MLPLRLHHILKLTICRSLCSQVTDPRTALRPLSYLFRILFFVLSTANKLFSLSWTICPLHSIPSIMVLCCSAWLEILAWTVMSVAGSVLTLVIGLVKRWLTLSKETILHCGVPQGSIIGPSQSLTIHKVIGHIIRNNSIDYHFYADDVQLFCSFDPTRPGDASFAQAFWVC